jgi:hypothetical protein
MSLYFDGFFACDLQPDTPPAVLDTLRYLTRTTDVTLTDVPDHAFFQTEGWRDFLRPHEDYRFAPGPVFSELKLLRRGDHSVYHSLCFRRSMHDDIEYYVHWWHFLYWIAPYSATVGYVGYCRETYSLHPTLIYFKNGQVFHAKVHAEPKGWYGEVWNPLPITP